MTKFKHKNGGIAEVFTKVNIARLQNDPDYTELVEANPKEKKSPKKVQEIVQEEEVEQEPLQ